MIDRKCVTAMAMASLLLLNACGGGGGGGTSAVQPSPLAGVYGDQLAPVLVDASGRMIGQQTLDTPPALGAVYVVFSGTVKANEDYAWSSNDAVLGQHIVPFTGPPGDPTLTPIGLDGSFVPGVSLTTNIHSAILSPRVLNPATWPIFVDPVYKNASLSIAAGSYSSAGSGAAFTITPDGRIVGTSQTGCAIDGSVSVGNPSINVYNISATLTGASCAATSGKRYDFLAFLASEPKPRIIAVANFEGKQGGFSGDRQ
jgi:hypothetical protein